MKKASETSPPSESKVLLWIPTERTTPFTPFLMERLARARTLHVHATKLIEKIRNVAQTNRLFRGDRLVASALGQASDRQLMASELRDTSRACFDNTKPLQEYSGEMSDAMQAICGYQDVFLRQVVLFAIKPLKDYLTVHYRELLHEFAELEKRRDRYDESRNKQSFKTSIFQQQLVEQAATVEVLADAIPEHQVNFANALDVYVRAECQFMKETKAIIDSIKDPEYKRRWNP